MLQFLARCLRSVEPPPRTVRDLSGQVLDHLLAGDLYDRARCLPLCWLLASCGACRDIVSEEIDARAAMLVESGDHLDGLRLAVALPVGIRGNWGGEGPRLPPEGPQRRFWDEHCRHNVDLYASHINAASVTDPGVRSLALRYKTLGIDDALMMPDGPLVLFKRHWIGIFGWWLGAYLPDAVCDLSLGTTGPASSARADLAAFGRFLLEHPRLPWITGEPNAWSEFFWGTRRRAADATTSPGPDYLPRRCSHAAHCHGRHENQDAPQRGTAALYPARRPLSLYCAPMASRAPAGNCPACPSRSPSRRPSATGRTTRSTLRTPE